MPTCLHCGDNIDVDDWDNPIEWETHWCEGLEDSHRKRAKSQRTEDVDTVRGGDGA